MFEWIIIVAGIVLYLLPSIIASYRKHPNGVVIFFVNFFLGWTFVGWIAALVWSATSHEGLIKEIKSDKKDALDILKRKYAEGKISEKIYRKRKKILEE